MSTVTATATEVTDTRLDVIGYARDVLERAESECKAWRGPYPFRVVAAMGAVEGALRSWGRAGDGEEKDDAVRMAAHWSLKVVAVVDAVMGPDAASWVAGDSSDEAGEWT